MRRRKFWQTALAVGVLLAWAGVAGATHECPNDIDNWPFQWTGMEPDGTQWLPGERTYGFADWDGTTDADGIMLPEEHPEDIDHNGDGVFDSDPNVVCTHLIGGDGYADMADGTTMYIFGFSDVTGVPEDEVITWSALGAELPAPTIRLREGTEFYLHLTNVGMMARPDLFDGHTVHWHGRPNATSMFDGLPESGIAVNMGQTFTYYYKVRDPGTFMYHCHVEVVEHMQMGMVGNFYVEAAQEGPIVYPAGGRSFDKFAYNDTDGSTGYTVEFPLQVIDLDPIFHTANEGAQPLPFADMDGRLFLINGRGYPDTLVSGSMGPAAPNSGWQPQHVDSRVEADPGDRILLRLSNLGTTHFFTMTALGLPMQVVGKDAKHLRSPDGLTNMYQTTNSITLAGGESFDVIIDTCGLDGLCGGANAADDIPSGTYHFYTRMFPELNNDGMDRGGAMTEIVIN